MSTMSQILLPGQPIPSSSSSSFAEMDNVGVYQRDQKILSSLVGEYAQGEDGKVQLRQSTKPRFIIPTPGSIILGRITRVNARQANVSILTVDGYPCGLGGGAAENDFTSIGPGFTNTAAGEDPTGSDFTGVIRVQDVRQTEKDLIKMQDCFRTGDIVRALVISLGDVRSYFLATYENHLGVIFAMPSSSSSSQNNPNSSLNPKPFNQKPMIPINWQEMQDPQTGLIEKRKVAKPEGV